MQLEEERISKFFNFLNVKSSFKSLRSYKSILSLSHFHVPNIRQSMHLVIHQHFEVTECSVLQEVVLLIK